MKLAAGVSQHSYHHKQTGRWVLHKARKRKVEAVGSREVVSPVAMPKSKSVVILPRYLGNIYETGKKKQQQSVIFSH